MSYQPNPELDLVLTREVDASCEQVWKAWTVAEHLKVWFCPKPWQTIECEIDLRPGGRFYTRMQGPEGDQHESCGCYLHIEPERQLIWTDALGPDYRPNRESFMTAMLTLEPLPGGTRYTAIAIHKDIESRQQHETMGFHQGWSTALDQLVEYVKSW
ncbi:SRPBCC family protein [Gynuella sunshinyii]|uniref:Activator of Hsp90 ATPase homologue 1/2-like C-terminal domain-containing protein n=1 Tax=Gynuella sunshinyii YC6258 TaxID=1445510 RepID=A0A0C5V6E6_9GAMM|nr:SRPBCC family protein [Gynuella sunshinyii]AJQ95030.1 hypothetical protein YC6258_02992 [Gynuella sunshinyii YC6258]